LIRPIRRLCEAERALRRGLLLRLLHQVEHVFLQEPDEMPAELHVDTRPGPLRLTRPAMARSPAAAAAGDGTRSTGSTAPAAVPLHPSRGHGQVARDERRTA